MSDIRTFAYVTSALLALGVPVAAQVELQLEACLSAVQTADPVARGAAQDQCLQVAQAACHGQDTQSIPCLQNVSDDLSAYADALVPRLPETPELDELLVPSYARKLARLRGQGWSQQRCVVPMIATISVEKRRGLCAVQRAYDRLKLAEDLARMAGVTLD